MNGSCVYAICILNCIHVHAYFRKCILVALITHKIKNYDK